MTPQIGAVRNLGVGLESTAGTAVTPTYWIPITGGVVAPVTEYAEDESNFGRYEAPVGSERVSEDASFKGEAVVRDDWIGVILANIIGEPSSSEAETGVYEHTYTYTNGQHTTLSMAMKDTIADEVSTYGMVNSLELSVGAKEILKANMEIMGRQLGSDSNSVSYGTTAKRYTGVNATFGVAADISGLSSPTSLDLVSLSLKFDQGVLPLHAFNSVTANAIYNQTLRVEGELEMVQANNTYRDYVTDGTPKAAQFFIQHPTLIGATEYSSLQFQFAELSFEEWEPGDSLRDIVTEKISFVAHYDPTEGTPQMLNCVLTNKEDGSDYST